MWKEKNAHEIDRSFKKKKGCTKKTIYNIIHCLYKRFQILFISYITILSQHQITRTGLLSDCNVLHLACRFSLEGNLLRRFSLETLMRQPFQYGSLRTNTSSSIVPIQKKHPQEHGVHIGGVSTRRVSTVYYFRVGRWPMYTDHFLWHKL